MIQHAALQVVGAAAAQAALPAVAAARAAPAADQAGAEESATCRCPAPAHRTQHTAFWLSMLHPQMLGHHSRLQLRRIRCQEGRQARPCLVHGSSQAEEPAAACQRSRAGRGTPLLPPAWSWSRSSCCSNARRRCPCSRPHPHVLVPPAAILLGQASRGPAGRDKCCTGCRCWLPLCWTRRRAARLHPHGTLVNGAGRSVVPCQAAGAGSLDGGTV